MRFLKPKSRIGEKSTKKSLLVTGIQSCHAFSYTRATLCSDISVNMAILQSLRVIGPEEASMAQHLVCFIMAFDASHGGFMHIIC